MRIQMAAAALIATMSMAVSAPAAHAEMNLLSSCTGKAALGAGAGALLGGMVAGKGAKTEGALLGAAVGGLGAFGVCKSMNANNTKKVDKAYQTAAATNQSYSTSWNGKYGTEYVTISKPIKDGSYCRVMHGTLTTPNGGSQALPQETYCRQADGKWMAV
jgi:surface antigen